MRSELRALLENQKDRWGIVRDSIYAQHNSMCMKLCKESIADIDRYLERHKQPVEEYEHFRKEDTP